MSHGCGGRNANSQAYSRRPSTKSTSCPSSPYAPSSRRDSTGSMTSPSVNSEPFVPWLPTPVESVPGESMYLDDHTLDETPPPLPVPPKSPSAKKLKKYLCPIARCNKSLSRGWLHIHIVMKHPESQEATRFLTGGAAYEGSKPHESIELQKSTSTSQRYNSRHTVHAMKPPALQSFMPDRFANQESRSTLTYENDPNIPSAEMTPEHCQNGSFRQRSDYRVEGSPVINNFVLHTQPDNGYLTSPQLAMSHFQPPIDQHRHPPPVSWEPDFDTVCSDHSYQPVMQEIDLARPALFGLVQQQLTYEGNDC